MTYGLTQKKFCFFVFRWKATQLKNKKKHSSRMRTARSSSWGGVSLTETPPDRDPPWTETPALDRVPSGERPPGKEHETRNRDPPKRNMGPGSQTGGDSIQRPPCEQTNTCKNSTLPQTSFASCNNLRSVHT